MRAVHAWGYVSERTHVSDRGKDGGAGVLHHDALHARQVDSLLGLGSQRVDLMGCPSHQQIDIFIRLAFSFNGAVQATNRIGISPAIALAITAEFGSASSTAPCSALHAGTLEYSCGGTVRARAW